MREGARARVCDNGAGLKREALAAGCGAVGIEQNPQARFSVVHWCYFQSTDTWDCVLNDLANMGLTYCLKKKLIVNGYWSIIFFAPIFGYRYALK